MSARNDRREPIGGTTVDPLPEPVASPARVEPEREGKRVVLVVEDDEGDRALVAAAFEECHAEVDLRFVEDGEAALDYLRRFGDWAGPADSPRPSLVLLDLNIPKVDGGQILFEVRDDPALRRIPIVVLAGSDDERDVRRAYDGGANSYFTKPASREGYRHVVRILEAYWLRGARLPVR